MSKTCKTCQHCNYLYRRQLLPCKFRLLYCGKNDCLTTSLSICSNYTLRIREYDLSDERITHLKEELKKIIAFYEEQEGKEVEEKLNKKAQG